MRCMLIGNYGAGNVGDEALKEYFLTRFPDIQWSVLSASPASGEFARLPAGLRSFFSFQWVSTLREMRRCDAVVFGGGSLFTDVESPFACFLWWLHAMAARLLGRRLVFAFQGVGPFRTEWGKRLTVGALKHADFLSVRDEESFLRCADLLKNKNCIRTSDPIFIAVQKSDSFRSQKVFVTIPRHNTDSIFEHRFAELSKKGLYDEIRLLSLQPDHPAEREALRTLSELAGRPVTTVAARTLDDLVKGCSDASLVLTQRYHGAIVALCVGVPVEIIAQKAGDKLWALKDAVARGTAEKELEQSRAAALAGENALKEWFVTSRRTA